MTIGRNSQHNSSRHTVSTFCLPWNIFTQKDRMIKVRTDILLILGNKN